MPTGVERDNSLVGRQLVKQDHVGALGHHQKTKIVRTILLNFAYRKKMAKHRCLNDWRNYAAGL